MSDKYKRRDIAIYKPNGKKSGGVAQFKISSNADCMFLECASQIGEMKSSNPYDWKNKIAVKLGEPDICKMLAYFRLHKPSAPLKLFHQSPDGTSKAIELKYQEYNGKPSYYLSVSHQKSKGGAPNRVNLPIGLDEVEYLRIGFKKALEMILHWD
jgi:Whirly transcription factor